MKQLSDIYVCAAMRKRGHVPSRVLGDGRRTVWVFESSRTLEEDLADFYAGTLLLPASEYAEAIRSTKGEAVNRAGAA